jgi:hypothetical protein
MATYKFYVFSNPAEGRDDDFNAWYEGTHIPEILQLPEWKGAERVQVQQLGSTPPEFAYIAIYDLETDDAVAAVKDLGARMGDGRLTRSDAMGTTRGPSYLAEVRFPHQAG